MSGSIELSLEQQFSIRAFEMQVQNLTCEKAQEFLVQLYKHMSVRDQMYKKLQIMIDLLPLMNLYLGASLFLLDRKIFADQPYGIGFWKITS